MIPFFGFVGENYVAMHVTKIQGCKIQRVCSYWLMAMLPMLKHRWAYIWIIGKTLQSFPLAFLNHIALPHLDAPFQHKLGW